MENVLIEKPEKNIWRSSLFYVLGDALSKGVTFLLLPVITSFLSASEYGIVSLSAALINFLALLTSFRGVINRFYYQFDRELDRKKFLGSFWVFLLSVTALVLGLMWYVGARFSDLLLPNLPFYPYISIVLLTVLLKVGFQYVVLDYYQAKMKPKGYMWFSITNMIFINGSILYFVVIRQDGALGYLQGELLSLILIAVLSGFILIREFTFHFNFEIVTPVLRFSFPLVLHYLFHWMLGMSDRIVLDRFVPLREVGIYSFGYQIALALQLFFTSINKPLVPIFSKASSDERAFQRISGIINYYCLVVVSVGVGAVLFSGPLLDWLFPPEYQQVKTFLPWLIMGIVFLGFYFIPMDLISMTSGNTRSVPVMTFTAAVFNLVLNILLIPRFGAAAAAVNTSVGYGILLALLLWKASREYPGLFAWGRLIKIAAVGFLAAAVGLWILRFSPLVNFILATLIFGLFPVSLWVLGIWKTDELAFLFRLFSGTDQTDSNISGG